MIFNKKLFRESTYKILTVLFLIGYNFTPPILAANEIFNFGSISDKLNVSQEIDTSEDILDEGISDPKWIAKGDNYSSQSVDSKLSTKSSAAFAAGGSCILDVEPSMGKLNCTANDVPTVIPTVNLIQGCNAPGDIAKFDLTLSVDANASDRYDIGLWVSKDGDPNKDSSETGMCQTFVFDKATYGDGDFCGDVQSGTMVTKTFSNIELVCRDDDGDGRLDVPVITTWRNSSDPNDCPSADRALPETKSKCKNDETFNIPVPIPGQIIVKKVTNPVDDNQEFDFFLTGPKSSFFSLKNNGIWDSGKVGTGGLPEGTYSLNETNPTNWKLDDVTCTSSFDDKETYSNISLQSGETVTCTFKNVKQTANLTIVKNVVNDNGGIATPNQFGISVNGTTVTSGTKGSYAVGEALTINEIGLTGYSFVSITGDSKCPTSLGGTITLEPGDDITCTITNDDIAPKLTLNKVVVNDNGGTLPESAWTLYAKQGDTVVLTGLGATGDADVVSTSTFKAGTYTLSESGPTGYSASDWVCDGGIQNGNNITVGLNENVVCTITNNDIAPKLTVTKVVVDGLFGTKSISDFPLFVGTTPVTSGAQNSFNAGSHTISETNQEGYTSVISGDCDANGNVTLALGDTKACTITNTSIWSQIIVKKLVAPTTDLTKFTFTGGLEGSIGHNETISKIVLPGTYSVSETLPTGWALTDLICSDTDSTVDKTTGTATYVVGNNEGVTCTYTNTKLGSISGHKWVDADGLEGTANDRTPVLGWTVILKDANGVEITRATTDTSGYYEFTGLLPANYIVTEGITTGWIVLLGESKDVTLDAGENEENVDFVNVKYGSIKVLKNVDGNGDGDLDDDVDKIGSSDWSWTINDVNAGFTGTTKSDLNPGTYTIKETGGLSNFHFVSLSCSGSQGITYPTPAVASIQLKSGEDVTCTYRNSRDLGTLIVKKVVVNDNGGKLEAKDFSFQIDSRNAVVFDTDGQNEFTEYAGLPYDILEVNPNTRGYTTSYHNCEDVLVPYGDSATCTITNNDIAPELTVIKNVTNEGNDGIKSASDFAITVTGTNVSNSNFQGSENGVTVTLNAGSYKVTEDEDTENYTASYDNCEGTINIGEKKTCTITNTGIDHRPSIEVTKEADKTSVDETGENVIFTFTVKNTSKVDTVTILSLVDSDFGVLAGDNYCKIGTELAPNTSCSFTHTELIKGDASGPNHENTFTATVKDEEGNETSDDDNQTITFKDVEPTLEVTKTVDDNSIPETGQEVTFTFTVKNTSEESVTITSLSDDVFTTLTGSESCKVGTELSAGGSCSFTYTTTLTGDASGFAHKNTFTVTVKDNDGSSVTDSDDATVEFEDVKPTVEVTKDADKSSIDETGESVTFTFTVKNTSEEKVTITTLTDSVFGVLAEDDDCKVGTILTPNESCSFTLTRTISGDYSGPSHKNIFTAVVTDNDNTTATDTDDETITFKDVLPSVEVTKTAGVTEIPETGGNVTFTYKVTNTGLEKVEITSLYDDQFGVLAGDDDCKVGTTLGAGESCESQATFVIPANTPGDPNAATSHKNIFTAVVEDNDGNEEDDDDDEVVTLTPVPSLKLVKNVVHKYNSDTSITAKDWTLHATGDGGFNYAGDTDEFRFVKAGVAYDLSEEGTYSPQFEASDWTCTGDELTGSTLTLAAEDDVVCTITNTALPARIRVDKDVLGGYSNDTFKVKIGDEVKDIRDSEEDELVAVFEKLDARTYNPMEVDIPNGYVAEGCEPVEGFTDTVKNGETIAFVCTNKVIDPLLQIEKSNDAVGSLLAGNEVTYTITVTAPDDKAEGTYVLNNVVVFDIAPAGFKYLSGTWTAQKNGVNIPVPEPTYDDKGQAKWDIGDMKERDVVVLTYKTKISLLQNPGNYPDIAWVSGKSIIDGDVLGASTVDPLTPFVGTDVTVIEPVETEEGEVLGASITLPVTGASTYLTLGALIMMILGVITLLLKPFKKLSYALLTGLMAVSFVSLLTPNRVLALDSDIKVRIMQPATPTNKNSFNVGFVALDLNNNSITVECYKDAEVTPFATFIANTGNCPVTVSASGTYTFFVKAKSASGEQKSADVTVVVDLEKPAPVIDYSKAGNVIKFKTPNDGKTKKVEIHRSTTSKYTANEGTRVHTMDVLPNTEYSWTDTTAEAGKTYYYALRTVDALGNVSTIVSDPEVVEVPTVSTSTATTTTTTTAATTGEVAGEKDTAEEGEVAGETDDVLEGEDKEVEKTEDEEEKTDIKETAKKAAGKWYIWVIAIVVIGGVAYYVRRQKRN